MPIKSFREILVWEKAHNLVLLVYELTKSFPRNEEFGLVSQMRRAAFSIPSNIAEGFKRRTFKESVRFYNIAEGSLEELKCQSLLARDLEYIREEDYQKENLLAEEVGRMLNSWKRSQK